eukprot:TRINITY_DN8238_c4_g1_i1.p1 TRINITY_DN8238_c4_g1~~TRINITY_DN8238_c4_g1_i1.p1  ORF type:complete len:484 (+),score=88.60 TRINITY_DN8238_c4_g1_i1:47-1453(+)
MAAATTKCPKCQAEVPSDNYLLHEARCAAGMTCTTASGANPQDTSRHVSREIIEAEIVQELNWVRTRPKEAIEVLRERLKHYKGKDYSPPDRAGRTVVTKEGKDVVSEAIRYLEKLPEMQGLGSYSEQGLALAAEDHIADIGQTGTASHTSSDGTSASDRAKRYGSYERFGECLWYGSELADARTVVLDLVVDDGVPSRGHREGVLNPSYTVVGVSYGSHCTFGKMAAMEFAKGWQPNEMFVRSRLSNGPYKMSEEVIAEAKQKSVTGWALGSCCVCKEAIKGGKVVEIKQLGGKLHADCFKCNACSSSLSGTPFQVHDSTPFCNGCYYERYGDKCKACDKVITGGKVKCSLGLFHVECVVCRTCDKAIGKNPFSTTTGEINCKDCEKEAAKSKTASKPAAATVATATAMTGARGGRTSLSSAGSAIAMHKSGAVSAAKAKPKAKPKVSMGQAHSTAMGVAMDYSSLA